MTRFALCAAALAACASGAFAAEFQPAKYYTWSDEIRDTLRALRKDAATKPKTIMGFGDSITYSDCFLWHLRTRLDKPGLLSSEGYVYQPKAWAARGGVESGWGKGEADKAIATGNPELATILFGTNDLQHRKTDAKAFRANIEYIVDACLKNKTIPVLVTIPSARTIKDDALEAFNAEVRELAAAKKLPLIDFRAIFRDCGEWQKLTFDGVHPNSKQDRTGGYDWFNDVFFDLYKVIEKDVLGRAAPALKPVKLAAEEKDGATVESWDRNGDGKPDQWITLRNGQRVQEEYDSDFDGRRDVLWTFADGKLVSGKDDLDRDGKLETPFEMKDGWKNETP